MSEALCTYEDCDKRGVGRVCETASHWLCEDHLLALKSASDTYAKSGDREDMKRMLGHTIRAMGGAKAATEKMRPSIETASKLFSVLSSMKKDPTQ